MSKQIIRLNTVLEVDKIGNSLYIYIYPFSYKNKPKVTATEQIKTKSGIYNFDWQDGKICGIEVLDANKNFNLNGR